MGEPEIESEVSMEELHEKSATLNGGLTSPASAAASATPARGNRSARVSVPGAFPSGLAPQPPGPIAVRKVSGHVAYGDSFFATRLLRTR